MHSDINEKEPLIKAELDVSKGGKERANVA